MRWAYGVTTVPERRDDLLPRTLASLAGAGFDKPRLFVDGETETASYALMDHVGHVTARYPRIQTFGNWTLGMAELFIRDPDADRYAIFQDDVVTVRNLRAYLDASWPAPSLEKKYLNLFTFRRNEKVVANYGRVGWLESGLWNEKKKELQTGEGALGLAFDRAGVIALLTHLKMVERPIHPRRGWRNVDGGVVNTLNTAGYREIIHSPSLLQHTGEVSAAIKVSHATRYDLAENRPEGVDRFPRDHRWGVKANTFPGEEVDALSFLPAG